MKKHMKNFNILFNEPHYNNKSVDDSLYNIFIFRSGEDLEEYEKFTQSFPKLIKRTISSKSFDTNNNVVLQTLATITDKESIQGFIHYLLTPLFIDTFIYDIPQLYSPYPFLQSICQRLIPSPINILNKNNIQQNTITINGLFSFMKFTDFCNILTNTIINNVYIIIII